MRDCAEFADPCSGAVGRRRKSNRCDESARTIENRCSESGHVQRALIGRDGNVRASNLFQNFAQSRTLHFGMRRMFHHLHGPHVFIQPVIDLERQQDTADC